MIRSLTMVGLLVGLCLNVGCVAQASGDGEQAASRAALISEVNAISPYVDAFKVNAPTYLKITVKRDDSNPDCLFPDPTYEWREEGASPQSGTILSVRAIYDDGFVFYKDKAKESFGGQYMGGCISELGGFWMIGFEKTPGAKLTEIQILVRLDDF